MNPKKNNPILSKLLNSNFLLFYISLFQFLLLIIFAGNYGFFRDEFYYIETTKHLAFGYVDLQPLSAIILAVSRTIFGDSILGIRIFAYLAGSITVFVSGLIARKMDGSKFTQILTAILVVFSTVVLASSSFFSMNSSDILLSTVFFYYLIKLLKTKDPKIWITIGIIIGIGLQNKLTFLFLGFGLFVGLSLTKERIYFKSKHFWIGLAIAAAIILPNIIWQISNGFPTIEFMKRAALEKNVSMSFLQFLLNSSLVLNPIFVIFIFTALYYLFINKTGKKFRLVGLIFIIVLLVFAFNNGKPYYMGVLYPVMLAAGVLGADILIEKYLRKWVRILLVLIIIPFVIIIVPYAIPILNVDSFINFSKFIGIKPGANERLKQGILPQFYADRFGWKDMVKQVADVYNTLTEDEKKDVIIFAQNYGETGAINYYGHLYNLPKAISGHNSYWEWGYPKDKSGNIIIIVGSNLKDNKEFFEDVKLVGHHYNKYGMPYENVDIFIGKKPKFSKKELWTRIKSFI